SLAQMNKPSDVDKATKKYSALRDASRAERAEFYFEPFCQLAPAFNGRGLFPSMAAMNKSLAESDKSGRRGNVKYSRTTREPLAARPNQTRKDSNVPPTYDRRSIGSRALNCCVRAARKLAPGGSGYARQGGRRRKGGPGRGAGNVPQGRGRFPG